MLERHYDRIHGLAWQLTGSRSDADDIAQDVCCVLVEKIASFRGEARFSSWLYTITFNAVRDWRRRHGSFQAMSAKLRILVGLQQQDDGRDLYDAAWIRSSIARLKPALRDTVVLVAGQQLTHAETAAILGISEATVSWRMHEARRILGSDGGKA